MIIYLSLLIALVGGIGYLITEKPKLAMLGIVAFGCGLLAFLIKVGPNAINLFQ